MIELLYKDITEKIIGASFEVHKFLGNACLPAGKAGLSGSNFSTGFGLGIIQCRIILCQGN
jgi:hypothetical protein